MPPVYKHAAPLGLNAAAPLTICALYPHAAPLGLNAAQFAVRHHRRGLVSKPDGLGNPTPTGSSVPFLLFPSSAFFASLRRCVKVSSRIRYHMSPLWGFGYLVYAVFYKHAAPLGLNAAMHRLPFAHCIHMPPRWG